MIGNKILAIERQLNHIYKCVEICQFQSKALNVQGEKKNDLISQLVLAWASPKETYYDIRKHHCIS